MPGIGIGEERNIQTGPRDHGSRGEWSARKHTRDAKRFRSAKFWYIILSLGVLPIRVSGSDAAQSIYLGLTLIDPRLEMLAVPTGMLGTPLPVGSVRL
jgi:hypothetical protein